MPLLHGGYRAIITQKGTCAHTHTCTARCRGLCMASAWPGIVASMHPSRLPASMHAPRLMHTARPPARPAAAQALCVCRGEDSAGRNTQCMTSVGCGIVPGMHGAPGSASCMHACAHPSDPLMERCAVRSHAPSPCNPALAFSRSHPCFELSSKPPGNAQNSQLGIVRADDDGTRGGSCSTLRWWLGCMHAGQPHAGQGRPPHRGGVTSAYAPQQSWPASDHTTMHAHVGGERQTRVLYYTL